MQCRELRPKGELLSLLQRLNDCVGISARRIFVQQVTPSELLQRPQSEIRQLLPELCTFVDSLVPITNNTNPNHNTIAHPSSSLVRRVFCHPDAQWLSRSARQSGVSALLCQLLVRLAIQEKSSSNSGEHWSAAELTIQLLLDALMAPCIQRLGQAPDACIWRPLQPKPRFHAMLCFPVWSSVLPFAAIMGIRYPQLFQQLLKTYWYARTRKKTRRVNCDFALLSGIWRLVNELDRGDKDKQDGVTQVMNDNKPCESHLEDQLLEKFFTGMDDFSFTSSRADLVLKQALLGALEEALNHVENNRDATSKLLLERVGIFTTAGCFYVKDLAKDVVSMIIKRIQAVDATKENVRVLVAFLVGFCTHVDLVPFDSILTVLELFLGLYQTLGAKSDTCRLKYVFFIVYIAIHRTKMVDLLRQNVSSTAALVLERLTHFQLQFCTEIQYEDFYVAAPVNWMANVWKHWIFLSETQVQSFVSEAQEYSQPVDQKRVTSWQSLIQCLPFTPISFSRLRQMNMMVSSQLIASIPLMDDNNCIANHRKRRRTENKGQTKPLESERAFDVLLLPDVMERVCSFMSAKRLCRMALVCRTLKEVSERASLWRRLYFQLGQASNKLTKEEIVPSSTVYCAHGVKYEHLWRQLYRKRWQTVQKVRAMQRHVVKKTLEQWNSLDTTFLPRICSYCGCDKVLKTARDQDVHLAHHKDNTCPHAFCRAYFTSVRQLKQHMKKHAAE